MRVRSVSVLVTAMLITSMTPAAAQMDQAAVRSSTAVCPEQGRHDSGSAVVAGLALIVVAEDGREVSRR